MSKHGQLRPPGETRYVILRYLQGFDERQWPCSVREVMAAAGLTSPATAHRHLRVLEREGLAERKGRKGWRAAA